MSVYGMILLLIRLWIHLLSSILPKNRKKFATNWLDSEFMANIFSKKSLKTLLWQTNSLLVIRQQWTTICHQQLKYLSIMSAVSSVSEYCFTMPKNSSVELSLNLYALQYDCNME